MFVKENKMLLLGTAGVVIAVLLVHMFWVNQNRLAADEKLKAAEENREKWEKNFKSGAGLLPRPAAEKAIQDSNLELKKKEDQLKNILFGTPDSLRSYTESAAGAGDKRMYLIKRRGDIFEHGKAIIAQSDLGIVEKVAEDPIPLNLLRLAMVDTLITDCLAVNRTMIRRIQYNQPRFLRRGDEDAEAPVETERKPATKKDAAKVDSTERLVQIPMKVLITLPEAGIEKLLYEIQKPSNPVRGYLCLRGYHVAVRSAGSGIVDLVIGVSALLNEGFIRDLKIPVKTEDDARHGVGGGVDLNR
ncbi:MAG TPA: hypothetical protein VGP72_11815 [Planctomycetota bacterium]|jgi:hypothetical protein